MKKRFLLPAIILILVSCNGKGGADSKSGPMDELVETTIRESLGALERAVGEVKDTLAYPTYATRDDLKWRLGTSRNWVSGFWPGCLWYASALSGGHRFGEWAESWTSGIEKEKYNTGTHDLGFRFMCTYGNAIRFFPERYADAYTPVVLTAAETLSKLYHPEFSALCSDWDEKTAPPGTTPCVIDIMMNLELLFWAAEHGGDPNYKQLCINHANTTWRDFRREDGGTYHVVRYDKLTGAIVDRNQLQGDVKESTWSRGHAWLVYGLVVCYRFTGDKVWLDRAKVAADYFIRNLNPDGIANWDFQSDVAYTDASASAIVCSALYELVHFLPDGRERRFYREQADRMLATLCSPAYFCGDRSGCLLAHSVRYYHKKDGNDQDPNIDEPCVFADYYFLEALYRYRNL